MHLVAFPTDALRSIIAFNGDPNIRVCRAINDVFFSVCWTIFSDEIVRHILPLEASHEDSQDFAIMRKVYEAVERQERNQIRTTRAHNTQHAIPFFGKLSCLVFRIQRIVDRNLCYFCNFESDLFYNRRRVSDWTQDLAETARGLRSVIESDSGVVKVHSTVRTMADPVTVLPPEIKYFTSLKILHLAGWEHLEFIPQEVAQLEYLQVINLTGCASLRDIPDLSHKQNLNTVYVMGCSEGFCRQLMHKVPPTCRIVAKEIFL